LKIDDSDEHTPGWKFNYWEMKGVPLRLEIGPRDIRSNQVMIVRRDDGKKKAINELDVITCVEETLDDIQRNIREKAEIF